MERWLGGVPAVGEQGRSSSSLAPESIAGRRMRMSR